MYERKKIYIRRAPVVTSTVCVKKNNRDVNDGKTVCRKNNDRGNNVKKKIKYVSSCDGGGGGDLPNANSYCTRDSVSTGPPSIYSVVFYTVENEGGKKRNFIFLSRNYE